MNIVTSSILLGLISMLGYGLSTVFSKTIIQKYGAAKSVAIREIYIVGFCLILALPFLHSVQNWQMFLVGILAGAVGYLPLLAFFKAIEHSPIGIVSPITSTAPIVSVVLSLIFLGTPVSVLQWVAISIIVIANILISLSVNNSGNNNWRAGIPYALFAMVGWGVYFFLLIPIARNLGPWTTPLATEGGVLISSMLFLLVTKQLPKARQIADPKVIFPAVCIFVGVVTYALACMFALPSIFSSLSQSSGIVAVVLGAVLLKERLGLRKRILTVVMIAGVVLLSLS